MGTHGLTRREIEVMVHVAMGLTNEEIAEGLSISRPTVAAHLTHVFQTLHVKSRSEAVYVLGWVTVPEKYL